MKTGEPGLKRTREITDIWMQSSDDRANQRRAFRKMAKDMAGRYLRQMEVFNRRGLHNLGDLLATEPEPIARASANGSPITSMPSSGATAFPSNGAKAWKRRSIAT